MPRVTTHFAPQPRKLSHGCRIGPTPFISVGAIAGIPAFVRRTFGDRLLQKVNQATMLDLELIEDQTCFIPYETMTTFVSKVAQLSGERDFGLMVAPHLTIASYGTWGAYILGAETLGAAIERAMTTIGLHSTGDRVSVVRSRGEARVGYSSAAKGMDGYEHVASGAAGVVLSLCRAYLPADWRPVRIELDFPKPRREAIFSDTFACPIVFDAPSLVVCIHARDLDRRRAVKTATGVVTLEDVTRERMERTRSDRLLFCASEQIWTQVLSGVVSIESTARSLGTSVRTLQRELNRKGTDFRAMANAARSRRAIDLMRGTDVSITDISTQLGYSAPAHFARAFRSAIGISPSEYRQSHRSGPALRPSGA